MRHGHCDIHHKAQLVESFTAKSSGILAVALARFALAALRPAGTGLKPLKCWDWTAQLVSRVLRSEETSIMSEEPLFVSTSWYERDCRGVKDLLFGSFPCERDTHRWIDDILFSDRLTCCSFDCYCLASISFPRPFLNQDPSRSGTWEETWNQQESPSG